MRRRRVLANAGLALGALAGCLGDRTPEERAETTAERDWEPATTDPNEAASRTAAPTGQGAPASATANAGPTGNERETRTRTRRPDRSPTFANGSDWEAQRAQVAANNRAAGRAVEFAIETAPLENCGTTCRELRAALTNTGTRTAHNVRVHTEVQSGGQVVREREDRVGDLPAGETYRASARVELGPVEAVRVREAGAITVSQTVTSEERREAFEQRIEVA